MRKNKSFLVFLILLSFFSTILLNSCKKKNNDDNKNNETNNQVVESKINYNLDGGSLNNPVSKYTEGVGLDTLPVPTKEGYNFLGWYKGEEKIESIKTSDKGDITLVAKWERIIIEHTITYILDGGVNQEGAPVNFIEGDEFALPIPTKDGYTFIGWYKGENKVDSITADVKTDLTLVAKWEGIIFDINLPDELKCGESFNIEIDYDLDIRVEIYNKSIVDFVNDKELIALAPGETKVIVYAGVNKVEKIIKVVDIITTNIPDIMICKSVHRVELISAYLGSLTGFKVETSNRRVVSYSGGYLEAYALGEAQVTVKYQDMVFEYTIKVIDELYITLNPEMKVNEVQTIECRNAQGKKMPDATLVSSNPDVIKVNSLSEIEAISEGSATLTLTWGELSTSVNLNVSTAYYFEYDKNLKVGNSSTFKITSSKNEIFSNYTLTSSDESIIKINEDNTYEAVSSGVVTLTLSIPNVVTEEFEVFVLEMTISGSKSMTRGGIQTLSIKFSPKEGVDEYTLVSSDESIIKILENNKIQAIEPGVAIITATSKCGLVETIEIEVLEKYYSITYDITDEEKDLLPEGFIENTTKFSIKDLPLELPMMEKDKYSFLGWTINYNSDEINLDKVTFEVPVGTNYNITLRTTWGLSRIDLSYGDTQIIGIGDTLKINTSMVMIPANVDPTKLLWSSDSENVLTVDQNGLVTGVGVGSCLVNVYLVDNPNINASIGVTVREGLNEMNDLLKYFVEKARNEIIAKNITVFGYQFNYEHRLLGSVTDFLFEEFVVNEDYMISSNMNNRPGDTYTKYYITVHDTASSASSGNGEAHASYVQQGGGGTSWHYTCASDGIYHHIPDNENAYHAGDGGRDYILFASGIKGTKINPVVTISEDGYYELDGVKSQVLAPKDSNGEICTTDDINDQGIRVVVQDGEYYIGNTYYNTDYNKISNAGGNDNSIGIESCVNQGSDLYYTWQKLAKLVAHLMKENNLTINDVKPHHYFSGKDCPMTMRGADLWGNFIRLVEFEYAMITKYAGYEVTFTSHNPEYLDNRGRIIKQAEETISVSYTITVTHNGKSESVTLWTTIPGSSQFTEIK